jgi:hypothetical protein
MKKILSQRWHPIQDLLTQLGIKMKEAWVDIVEAMAKKRSTWCSSSQPGSVMRWRRCGECADRRPGRCAGG